MAMILGLVGGCESRSGFVFKARSDSFAWVVASTILCPVIIWNRFSSIGSICLYLGSGSGKGDFSGCCEVVGCA